ncbi:MAG TPA: flagellar biosynthetic protein FliR [Pantanalinema sp.]
MDLAALMQLPPGGLEVALLVLVRISALFVIAPVFGNQVLPMRFRVGLAVLVTLLILPIALSGPRPALDGANALALAVGRELAVGLLIGFVAMTFFYAVQFAGHLLGLQMGFGMSMMFDPTTRSQTSEIAVLLLQLATVCFLALNAHHWLLAAVWRSFETVPLATFTPNGVLLDRVIAEVSGIFDTALTIMLPITGIILVIELALAILNRVIPQMNVFSISMGVKVLLGLGTLAATLPLIGGTFDLLVDRLNHRLLELFR